MYINIYIYLYINTELLSGNKGHQEETHHSTHRFRRLFLDLLSMGWRGCDSAMGAIKPPPSCSSPKIQNDLWHYTFLSHGCTIQKLKSTVRPDEDIFWMWKFFKRLPSVIFKGQCSWHVSGIQKWPLVVYIRTSTSISLVKSSRTEHKIRILGLMHSTECRLEERTLPCIPWCKSLHDVSCYKWRTFSTHYSIVYFPSSKFNIIITIYIYITSRISCIVIIIIQNATTDFPVRIKTNKLYQYIVIYYRLSPNIMKMIFCRNPFSYSHDNL